MKKACSWGFVCLTFLAVVGNSLPQAWAQGKTLGVKSQGTSGQGPEKNAPGTPKAKAKISSAPQKSAASGPHHGGFSENKGPLSKSQAVAFLRKNPYNPLAFKDFLACFLGMHPEASYEGAPAVPASSLTSSQKAARQALLHKAEAYYEHGCWPESLALFQKVLALEEDGETLCRVGQLTFKTSGPSTLALRCVVGYFQRAALEGNAMAWFYLAALLPQHQDDNGELSQAYQAFVMGIMGNPLLLKLLPFVGGDVDPASMPPAWPEFCHEMWLLGRKIGLMAALTPLVQEVFRGNVAAWSHKVLVRDPCVRFMYMKFQQCVGSACYAWPAMHFLGCLEAFLAKKLPSKA